MAGFGTSLLDLARRAGKTWWGIVAGGFVGLIAIYESFLKDHLPSWAKDWMPGVLSFLGDLGPLPLVVAVVAAFLWAYHSLRLEKVLGSSPVITFEETDAGRRWEIAGMANPTPAIKALLSGVTGTTGGPGTPRVGATQPPGLGASETASEDVESP